MVRGSLKKKCLSKRHYEDIRTETYLRNRSLLWLIGLKVRRLHDFTRKTKGPDTQFAPYPRCWVNDLSIPAW